MQRLFFTSIVAFGLTQAAFAQKIVWEYRPSLPQGYTRIQVGLGGGMYMPMPVPVDYPIYLGSSGVCVLQAMAFNTDSTSQKTILYWIASRGTPIGILELDADENVLGFAQVSGNYLSFYTAKYSTVGAMWMTEKIFLKTYRSNNGVVQQVKSTELSGVARSNMKLFPPQSTTSGGAIAWGYDDPTNYTGFWIRRYSPL